MQPVSIDAIIGSTLKQNDKDAGEEILVYVIFPQSHA